MATSALVHSEGRQNPCSALCVRGQRLGNAIYARLPYRAQRGADLLCTGARRVGSVIYDTGIFQSPKTTAAAVAVGGVVYMVASPAVSAGLIAGAVISVAMKIEKVRGMRANAQILQLRGGGDERLEEILRASDETEESGVLITAAIVTSITTWPAAPATLVGGWIVRTATRAHYGFSTSLPRLNLETARSATRATMTLVRDLQMRMPDNIYAALTAGGVAYAVIGRYSAIGFGSGLVVAVVMKALGKKMYGLTDMATITTCITLYKITDLSGALATALGAFSVRAAIQQGPTMFEQLPQEQQERVIRRTKALKILCIALAVYQAMPTRTYPPLVLPMD